MPTAADIVHVEFSRTLPATSAHVFDLLTQPAHLRAWFAEHVEVDPRVNGPYRFWGRHTPFTPTPDLALQRLTRVEPGRALRFSWPWADADTEVLVELKAAAPASTALWVRHSLFTGTLSTYPRAESRFFVEDFWGVALGNLRSYLAHGSPALLPDFSAPGPTTTISIDIHAPIHIVWNALTDPATMNQWLSTDATANLRPGGAYSYGWTFDGITCGPRTILELDPPHKLVHDWHYTPDSPTRTEWTLTPLSSTSTRVTITQIGLKSARDHTGYTGGWAKFAHALKQLLESSTP